MLLSSLTQHNSNRRTTRMTVRSGETIRYSSVPSIDSPLSPSPVSSPDHSPPRQRLRRTTETDEDEDPEEDPVPTEPMMVDTLPVEHTLGDIGLDSDRGIQVELEPVMMPREGKGIMEDVQGVFEVGQSSRDAQMQGPYDIPWIDIACDTSVGVQIATPDYTPSSPSFVPPPSPEISPFPSPDISPFPSPILSPFPSPVVSPHPPASPQDEEPTDIQRIWNLLHQLASLLDVHTDQLGRLGSPAHATDRIAALDRAYWGLFEEIFGVRRHLVGLTARFEALERAHCRELRDLVVRVSGLGQGQTRLFRWMRRTRGIERDRSQRLMAAERMIGALTRENEGLRRRVDQTEATIGGMTAAFERLRLDRDQA